MSLNSIGRLLSDAYAAEKERKFTIAADIYVNVSNIIYSADNVSSELKKKANEYSERANQLRETVKEEAVKNARQLLKVALEKDGKIPNSQTITSYKNAAMVCLDVGKLYPEKKDELRRLALKAIERAEVLQSEEIKIKNLPEVPKAVVTPRSNISKVVSSGNKNTVRPTPPSPQKNQSAGIPISNEEKEIIKINSNINGKVYLPFLSHDASRAALSTANGAPWYDPNGLLALSEKQKERLSHWKRADQVVSNPVIYHQVSPRNVTQTCVSDCSFVSAMILSAGYERKFKKYLITCSLFPQENGRPVINPCGKYCIRLYINGCWRRVLIDTQLPFADGNRMLCSYSADKSELWVSLIEKAYMKVMGGYDFPGSNSSVDLNALTGWIPERKALNDKDAINLHKMLKERMAKGQVLVTMATGEIARDLETKSGLVPTHAYALLDVRSYGGLKFFKLKNPWAEQSWKGKYSSRDLSSWTTDLKKTLSFDPVQAQKEDNGIFWIEWNNLVQFFDVCYMSWDPNMFKYRHKYHGRWTVGPKKDLYSMGNNPQYLLSTKTSTETDIWIVLSRHIILKNDFANNKDFITLLIYKQDGERIYLPNKNKILDGVRINSPFYLAKLKVPQSDDVQRYTLVVSEYEKTHDITFTIEVFSNIQFNLSCLEKMPHKIRKTGEWTIKTAGGCANYPATFNNNPIHIIEVDKPTMYVIELRAPKEYSVCIHIADEITPVSDSGAYRPGYTLVRGVLKPGKYTVKVSSFKPNNLGKYFLDFNTNNAINFF